MIYYCIPCHNEERTVGIVLWKIRQVMADFRRDYQILVADDASTDESYTVLEPYARVLPLTLMRNDQRRGYAATLEMLLREAVRRSDYPKRDAIVVLQADFTDDPEFGGALLRKLESGADIAVGDPVTGTRSALPYGFSKRLARRRKWPPEIRDPIHGFNAFRLLCVRKAVEARGQKRLLTCEGWAANAELLYAAVPHARRIESVDIVTHPDRLQRASRVAAWRTLREAWRFGRAAEGRPALAADALVPDRVHGDRATLRTDGAAAAPATAAPPESTERPERRARRGESGRARPDSRRGSREGRPSDRTGDGQPAERRGRAGERRPRGTGASTGEDAQGRPRRSAPTGEAGEATPRKRRRGRRGGRAKDRPAPAPVQEGAVDSPDESAAPVAGGSESEPDAGGSADDAGQAERPKRRRRGRRGGRRRRSGGDAAGTQDANSGGGDGDGPPAGGDGEVPQPDSTKES